MARHLRGGLCGRRRPPLPGAARPKWRGCQRRRRHGSLASIPFPARGGPGGEREESPGVLAPALRLLLPACPSPRVYWLSSRLRVSLFFRAPSGPPFSVSIHPLLLGLSSLALPPWPFSEVPAWGAPSRPPWRALSPSRTALGFQLSNELVGEHAPRRLSRVLKTHSEASGKQRRGPKEEILRRKMPQGEQDEEGPESSDTRNVFPGEHVSQARLPPVPGACPASVTNWGGRLRGGVGGGFHRGAEGTSASFSHISVWCCCSSLSTWLSCAGRRGSSGLQRHMDRFPLGPQLWDTHPQACPPLWSAITYLSITDLVGTLRVGPVPERQPRSTCTPMVPPCLEAQPPLTWSLRCEDQVLLGCL